MWPYRITREEEAKILLHNKFCQNFICSLAKSAKKYENAFLYIMNKQENFF